MLRMRAFWLLVIGHLIKLGVSTPDFIISQDLFSSLEISVEYIPEGDCQYNEGCVSGFGERILVRFDTGVANIGSSDFILGDISNHPNAIYDPCHQHYHFTEWMEYQVFAQNDINEQYTLIDGFKQGFCLMDSQQYDKYTGNKSQITPIAQYTCLNQGISVGWMDIYSRQISCQYVDITEFDIGTYTLKAIVNPDGIIPEINYNNNEVSTIFEFDGCINSYYYSNYSTSKMDLRIWRKTMNNFAEDINGILILFQNGISELCFNPGGCLEGDKLLEILYGFHVALDIFKFIIDDKSIVYGTGYWFARAKWTMHSKTGCKFIKSDALLYVYYDNKGNMGRTKLTSEQNNELESFLFALEQQFICQKPMDYAKLI